MSTEPPSGGRNLGGIVISGVVFIAASIGVRTCINLQNMPPSMVEEFEALVDHPVAGPAMREVRDHFPDEWVRLRAIAVSQPPDVTAAQLGGLFQQEMARFTGSHRSDVAAAPDENHAAIVRSTLALMEILQPENVAACAALATMGPIPAGIQLSDDASSALRDVGFSNLVAIREGIAHPTRRAEPSDADIQQLMTLLRQTHASASTLGLMDGTIDEQTAAPAANCLSAIETPGRSSPDRRRLLGRLRASDLAPEPPQPAAP